jgi:hypothetical protein
LGFGGGKRKSTQTDENDVKIAVNNFEFFWQTILKLWLTMENGTLSM